MNKSITTSLVILLFAISFNLLPAQGIEFVHDKSYQEVLDMAKAEKKLIFMDCYTTWCGPCKRLSAMVFPDPKVGAFYNATFVNTKFDMEKGEGPSIASKYGIRAYPTLLWLDGEGNVVHKVVGGLDPDGLIQNGRKAIDPTPGILAGMRKQYDEGNRDIKFLSEYLNTLYAANQKPGEIFNEYIGKLSAKDLADKQHIQTIFNHTDDFRSPGMEIIRKDKSRFMQVVSAPVYYAKMNEIAAKAVSDAPAKNDKTLFDGAMELLKNTKAPDHEEKTVKLSMDYYFAMSDWVNYDKYATLYIKKYAAGNLPVINDIAWNYFLNILNPGQLQKATKWAYDVVNKDNKYTYNLTYAYLQYKQNNYDEALKACDYAIIRAKEENINSLSAEALRENIQKSMAKP